MEMEMPVEMIEEILVRLPVKSLVRFKCVCKHWCDVIESRRFVDRHCCHDSNRDRLVFRRFLSNIEHRDEGFVEQFEEANGDGDGDVLNLSVGLEYPMHDPYDQFRMGPVNGVFCVVSGRGTIDLFNPATREVKRLPSLPPLPRPRPWRHLRFGFGLDPSTGDYKTVALYEAEFACVHTSSSSDKSECWRFIEGVDPSLLASLGHMLSPCETSWEHLCGGFCNGVYYWVCGGILAFDTTTETFREIQPPAGVSTGRIREIEPPTEVEDIYYGGVGVYGGSTVLFLSRSFPVSDVWVLGNGDGDGDGDGGCWSKILSFPTPTMPPLKRETWIPLCVWKNEMVLDDNAKYPNLISVDICTHKATPLRLRPPQSHEALRAAFSYKESLVSFHPNRLTKLKRNQTSY